MLELSDLPYTQAEALDILQHCPRWMEEGGYHATMQGDTRLYNPRTQTFCNRSLHLCVMQMEAGAEEEMHLTQQYHSSMYDEMVEVSALETLAGVTLKAVLADEANYKLPVAPVDDEGELVSDEDLLAEEIETLKELQTHITKFHTRKNFRASLARTLKRLESIASESTSV